MSARGIILLIFFVGSIPICFFRPFYGVLMWVIVSFLNPQGYAWQTGHQFPWAMMVAVPTLVGTPVFVRRALQRVLTPDTLVIAVLWFWFTITTLVSTHSFLFANHAVDTWFRWSEVSKVLLMTIMTVAIVQTLNQYRILLMVTALSFGVFVLKALPFMIATGANFRIYGPPKSMIADNNDLGLALDMTLPLFFLLAQTETAKWVKRFFGFLFVVTIPAILFTYSRGALLGLMVVLLAIILQTKRRMLLVPVAFVGLIAALLAPQSWKDRMDPTSHQVLDASARSRINAWTFCSRLAHDYPVTGGGFETFTPELFLRYAPNPNDVHGPHSVYFGVLAEHGYVGLALYLFLIASFFWQARRLSKYAPQYWQPTASLHAKALRASCIAFLTAGAFLGRAYFDYFFALVAFLMIAKRTFSYATVPVLEEEEQSPAEETDFHPTLEGAVTY